MLFRHFNVVLLTLLLATLSGCDGGEPSTTSTEEKTSELGADPENLDIDGLPSK